MVGSQILMRAESLRDAAKVARWHHERYDGKGYPDRLEGEQIPLHARVVAIADAYDAMRSDRIYLKGLLRETIRSELINSRGTQFDPALLDVFLEIYDRGELAQYEKREDFRLGDAADIAC